MWLMKPSETKCSMPSAEAMEITSLCLMLCLIPAAARLDIRPNSAQFFQYTKIFLRCVEDSSGWMVTRNTSRQTSETCKPPWGIPGESSCTTKDTYPSDTGVYWCQSPQNEVSNTVSITVKVSGLILEVPALPVMEGDNVTLRCSYREKGKEGSSSGFTSFYQDQVFKGNEPAGVKTLSPVTKDHEGLHMCKHPTFGDSPESLLTVTGHLQVIGSLQPITATEGDDIILPCHLNPPINVERQTVEWSKPDLKPDPSDRLSRVEIVHLYRNRREVTDMKIQSYLQRTQLFPEGLKQGNISLKITNVSLEDSGRYKCLIPKLKTDEKEAIVVLRVAPTLVPASATPAANMDVEGPRNHLLILVLIGLVLVLVLVTVVGQFF
ncbi:uncharacterized protein V6R79_018628 [Siganus canaliculatus]